MFYLFESEDNLSMKEQKLFQSPKGDPFKIDQSALIGKSLPVTWDLYELFPGRFKLQASMNKGMPGMLNIRGSIIQGFHAFKNLHPGHRQKEIEAAIEKGIRFLENKQQVDGSWYGYRMSNFCSRLKGGWERAMSLPTRGMQVQGKNDVTTVTNVCLQIRSCFSMPTGLKLLKVSLRSKSTLTKDLKNQLKNPNQNN
ncbi:dammarenediol II synthase-like protein [Tanacetum coccineum]|uniref:Dammarenediol II synthase-like protein n=1 Tax=Tanacetum coccineum TaxID=301880 RepID=A0ABQ5GAK1_9ASTR